MRSSFIFYLLFLSASLLANLYCLVVFIDDVTLPSYSTGTLNDLKLLLKTSVPGAGDSKAAENTNLPDSIYFTGDILLGRNVEYLMSKAGVNYPFKNFAEIFATNTPIVSNFEAAIPAIHKKTPLFNTKFSVDKSYLSELYNSGIRYVSLANNHSFDYGEVGYANTLSVLFENNITAFGHPTVLSSSSITYITTSDKVVAILSLHTLFAELDETKLSTLIDKMKAKSDYQIAFVHSGDEYKLYHNNVQENLAHKLIDMGIDAYIGHHPHVVQDIEVYKGSPIFYSLGNFIFDQYFSVDVKQGLVLKLNFIDNKSVFTLIPVTSEGMRSRPALMEDQPAKQFLLNLSRRSDSNYSENIKSGKLILPFSLATSTVSGIIRE